MKKYCFTFILVLSALISDAYAAARYVSIAPSTTEILFALGLDENIAGVSTNCNYPDGALSKSRVGDFSSPNMEMIFSLKPDYIFCTGLEQAPAVTELKRLKLKVYVADPSNLDELFATIHDIGKITGRETRALELIGAMRSDIASIKSKTADIPPGNRKKVFMEIWHDPLMTAGRGSFVDELITLAGGINIASEVSRPYSNFSAEKVVNLDPDVIILAYMDRGTPLKLVAGRFGWNTIAAVKNNRVYNDISPDIILRPGPRITQGLKAIYGKLYEARNGKNEN